MNPPPRERVRLIYSDAMTLGRKMAYQTGAMIVGLLLVSAASLWGINGLSTDYGVATEAYQDLRHVYAIKSYMETASKLLTAPRPQQPGAGESRRELAGVSVGEALREFNTYAGRPTGFEADQPGAAAPLSEPHRLQKSAVEGRLREAWAQLRESAVRPSDGGRADDLEAVGRVVAALNDLDVDIRATIKATERAAADRRRMTMAALALLALFTMVGALVLGVMQYRDVVLPLSGLAWAVRRVTRGRFTDRIDFGTRGRPGRYPAEFARLADDFNRMAAELDELYHKLEAKVAAKSKELVRSERLASVGFLAAGVAHEINNPLGIIVGYAEVLMMELKERQAARRAAAKSGAANITAAALQAAADAEEDLEKTLQVICDEAFRCKSITYKLLSMAKPGEDARRPVNLGDVAASVVSVLGGVKPYRDRRLSVRAESSSRDDLVVTAVEAEMKQVVMNLAINALEAVAPMEAVEEGAAVDEGEVRINVARRDGFVELTVEDDGKGMSPQTLERIFEPFYTEKRGAGTDISDTLPQGAAAGGLERRHGTGLGLSITHAIVEAHGGHISAHSEGVGKGSVFKVRLPAAVAVPLPTQELAKP
jgi:signal transduction histidine kinase